MHQAFKKIAEKDGATLWAFDFQFGPNPLMVTNYSLKVAVKDGRAQANLQDNIGHGLYWNAPESSEAEFERQFETFLARLQGK